MSRIVAALRSRGTMGRKSRAGIVRLVVAIVPCFSFAIGRGAGDFFLLIFGHALKLWIAPGEEGISATSSRGPYDVISSRDGEGVRRKAGRLLRSGDSVTFS